MDVGFSLLGNSLLCTILCECESNAHLVDRLVTLLNDCGGPMSVVFDDKGDIYTEFSNSFFGLMRVYEDGRIGFCSGTGEFG